MTVRPPILMLPLDRDLTPTERTTILERWMPRPLGARDWRQLDHDLTRLAAECERLQLRLSEHEL